MAILVLYAAVLVRTMAFEAFDKKTHVMMARCRAQCLNQVSNYDHADRPNQKLRLQLSEEDFKFVPLQMPFYDGMYTLPYGTEAICELNSSTQGSSVHRFTYTNQFFRGGNLRGERQQGALFRLSSTANKSCTKMYPVPKTS